MFMVKLESILVTMDRWLESQSYNKLGSYRLRTMLANSKIQTIRVHFKDAKIKVCTLNVKKKLVS